MSRDIRARAVLAAPLVISGLLVSGCMGSPTYGTDKTAGAQLTTDLTGMFSLKPKTKAVGEYKPRPELVKPTTRTTELPPPQENIVTASTDVWPESPEQRRGRIRADATENRDKPGFEPEVINDISVEQSASAKAATSNHSDSGIASGIDSKKHAEEFKRQLAASQQGSPTVRKTLTEPPLEYRVPADTAATDELGEDEFKKARRLKAEARKKSGDSSWRDLVPWL
jgi:hypothetical protein